MSRRLAAFVMAWLLPLAAHAVARYALLVGSDEGAAGRPRLWYAAQDAHRFAAALTELGDFPREHVTVLEKASLSGVRQALAALDARIEADQKGGDRGLILFYFSGHANEHGLELGSEELSYEELRRLLTDSPSKARIAVVDACHSGVLTQAKGGVASADVAFTIPSEEVEGVAFLASSSAGEQSQESTLLQGSFFTSHLEAAMRGAGDLDGDRRVTLSEAFFYTATHTTEETARTEGGAQHPTYNTHLSGRGDVVLSDLRRADATVTLPLSNGAMWMVRGRGEFLAQVPGADKPQRIALSAGDYTIERVDGEYAEVAEVSLSHGDQKALPPLSPRRLAFGAAKGGRGPNELSAAVSFASGVMKHDVGGLTGRVAVARAVGPVRLRLTMEGGRQGVTDRGLSYDLSSLGASFAVLVPVVWTPARLEVGAQGGGDWLNQLLESGRTLNAVDAHGEGLVMLSYPVGVVRVGMEVAAGVRHFPLNGSTRDRFFATGALFGGWEF
jgi:uncharacterized caspase-like protein